MTVIVAAQTLEEGIVIASDSQISDHFSKMDGYTNKIWADEANNYIVGACGSIREAQVVQYAVEWPKFREEEHSLPKFAIVDMVAALRSGVEGHGILKEKNGVESLESEYVVAWEDHFICICADFSVVIPVKGRMCIGSGYAEAYGALGDSEDYTLESVIEAARRATITANGVGGDIYYISTLDPVVRLA